MGALPLYIIFEHLALVTCAMPERQRGDNLTAHVHKCTLCIAFTLCSPIYRTILFISILHLCGSTCCRIFCMRAEAAMEISAVVITWSRYRVYMNEFRNICSLCENNPLEVLNKLIA